MEYVGEYSLGVTRSEITNGGVCFATVSDPIGEEKSIFVLREEKSVENGLAHNAEHFCLAALLTQHPVEPEFFPPSIFGYYFLFHLN